MHLFVNKGNSEGARMQLRHRSFRRNHLFSKFPFESTKKDIISVKEVVDDRDGSNSRWVAGAVHNRQKFCFSEILKTSPD